MNEIENLQKQITTTANIAALSWSLIGDLFFVIKNQPDIDAKMLHHDFTGMVAQRAATESDENARQTLMSLTRSLR